MGARWNPEACAAIDALRSGVVNRHVVRNVTFGRADEIAEIEQTIMSNEQGSCQTVIGRYGVGKSHLCEVLDERLQDAGYAVARLELGAAHGRAENPDAVLATVERSICVRFGGRQYRGGPELNFLALSARQPVFQSEPMYALRKHIYERLPGDENVCARIDALKAACFVRSRDGSWVQGDPPSIIRKVPSQMTAANLAVSSIVHAASELRRRIGVRGVVLLLDEAERGNWAYNNYRFDRAYDLLTGLALTSANLSTYHLKHYRDDKSQSYCPVQPSMIHTVYWFSHLRGLGTVISNAVGASPILLEAFDANALRQIREQVETLYSVAYGGKPKLDRKANDRIRAASGQGDTRSVVREVVAALDHCRLSHSEA